MDSARPLTLDDMQIEKTCSACPTQFDIYLPDGRYVYFRYRHGYLSLEMYRRDIDFGSREPVAQWGQSLGDAYDGILEDEESMAIIAERVPQLAAQATS